MKRASLSSKKNQVSTSINSKRCLNYCIFIMFIIITTYITLIIYKQAHDKKYYYDNIDTNKLFMNGNKVLYEGTSQFLTYSANRTNLMLQDSFKKASEIFHLIDQFPTSSSSSISPSESSSSDSSSSSSISRNQDTVVSSIIHDTIIESAIPRTGISSVFMVTIMLTNFIKYYRIALKYLLYT